MVNITCPGGLVIPEEWGCPCTNWQTDMNMIESMEWAFIYVLALLILSLMMLFSARYIIPKRWFPKHANG